MERQGALAKIEEDHMTLVLASPAYVALEPKELARTVNALNKEQREEYCAHLIRTPEQTALLTELGGLRIRLASHHSDVDRLTKARDEAWEAHRASEKALILAQDRIAVLEEAQSSRSDHGTDAASHSDCPLGEYEHYKGDRYTATGLAYHHETRELFVVYRSHAKKSLNIRPLRGSAADPDGWLTPKDGRERFRFLGPATATHNISEPSPLPMRLPCPACSTMHEDVGEFATKPHHTHACQNCGNVWRPAVFATVGVLFLPGFKNKGGIGPHERDVCGGCGVCLEPEPHNELCGSCWSEAFNFGVDPTAAELLEARREAAQRRKGTDG
jgi:hypothetical protein